MNATEPDVRDRSTVPGPNGPSGTRFPAPSPWARAVAPIAAIWALGYGGLRLYWVLTGLPYFPPLGADLVFFSGWGVVSLCAAAVVLALGLAVPRPPLLLRRGFALLGLVVSATLVASCALLLLDLVGLLLGLGIPTGVLPLLSRSGCLATGLLLAAAVLAAHRRARPVCPHCGRGPRAVAPDPGAVPWWAYAAGYGAVSACAVRFTAEVIAESGGASMPLAAPDATPAMTAGLLVFLAGLVAAGSLLPLALVHRWGRVWPRWVPLLAGRGVPRWLVLGPAVVLGTGLVCYFGTATVQMTAALFGIGRGFATGGGYGQAFFWTAVPAYLLWGVLLCVAAGSYGVRTRPRCRHCHQE